MFQSNHSAVCGSVFSWAYFRSQVFFGNLDFSTFPRPFDNDFDFGLVLGNHVRGQDAAPEDVRVNHCAATEDAAGVQHGVAADFRAVAQQRAELAQAGVERHAVHLHLDVAGQELDVGNLHARAEVRLVAENGVADVIVMRHLRAVEEQRVFQLGGIADHAAVADDDVLADVGVVPDLAVFPDDGRAFDHRAGFHDRAFADDDAFADARAGKPLGRILFRHLVETSFDFLERVPGELAIVKNRGVFGLREVKQVGWLEHGGRLIESGAAEKGNGAVS